MWRSAIVALALGLCCPVQGNAQSTEAALRSRLAEARRMIDAGDLQQGHAAVLAVVDDYADDAELLLQIHRVKELLKLAAFRATHERPQARELISGELKSYDKRSGRIKVHYVRDPDARPLDDEDEEEDGQARSLRELLELLGLGSSLQAGDFTWAYGVPMHPIVFDGPYSVEISGRIPDRRDIWGFVYSDPQVLINAGEEGLYRIRFGYPRTEWGFGKGASIEHIQGDRIEELDSDRGTPLEIGEDYTVKVNVSSKTITASANGKTFLKARKKGRSFGQFGFRGCPDISGLVLNGKANTAWLEGLADRWLAEAWTEFDEVYDPLDELSTELADLVGRAAEVPTGLLPEYPGPRFAGNDEYLERFEEFAAKGSDKKIVNYLEDMAPSKTSAGFRMYLFAVVRARLGELQRALGSCDEVVARFPEFVPAHLLRAHLLQSLGREQQAIADLRVLIASKDGHGAAAAAPATPAARASSADGGAPASPSAGALPPPPAGAPRPGPGRDPRVHRLLTTLLVQRGDHAAARQAMLGALEAGVAPAELEPVAFMLTRARFGPEWIQAHAFQSKHYDVRSDLSEKTCAEATKTLEQSLSMYDRMFARRPAPEGAEARYLVYVFSGSAGYMAYAGDLFGSAPVNTAGLYSPVLKQLLIWNLPDHEMMMRTIRHEGFHQYLDRLLPDPPTWFNEGTAEYFETARLSRGQMTPGTPLMSSVLRLTAKGTRWVKLSELVLMSPAEFYRDPALHYPEAWALVHYLLHSGRDEKRRYESYHQALLDGADREGAAEAAFGDVDWRVLERAVKAHVRALAKDD